MCAQQSEAVGTEAERGEGTAMRRTGIAYYYGSCNLQDPIGIFEEPTKVHVRERASCKHLPGGEKIPCIVTGTIMFPIPFTCTPSLTWPYMARKGKRATPVFPRQKTNSQQAPGRGRGRVLKFNQAWSCEFDIGLRILISEFQSCDLKSLEDLQLPSEAGVRLSPHMEKV